MFDVGTTVRILGKPPLVGTTENQLLAGEAEAVKEAAPVELVTLSAV